MSMIPQKSQKALWSMRQRMEVRQPWSRLTIFMHCAVTIAQALGRWHSKATPKRATIIHVDTMTESALPHRW